jgi:hypothetical protein
VSSQLTQIRLLLMLVVSLGFASSARAADNAPSAVLYLAPASIRGELGSSVTISARVTASGDTANAVVVRLEYPPSKLVYVSSAINSALWEVTAAQSAGAGTVDIEVGTKIPVSGDQLVVAVTFTVINGSGDIPVSIADTSMVMSSTTNTDLLRHPLLSLSISRLKPIRLRHSPEPRLRFTAQLSQPTTLDVSLVSLSGKRLAAWRKHANSGRNTFALSLPLQARHAGRERLTISTAGSTAPKTYVITLTP